MSATFLGMPAVAGAPASKGWHLRGRRTFPEAAHETLQDAQLRRKLGRATATIRDKRLRVTAEVPDCEELRLAGEALKASTMARLPELLEQLEAAVTARGGTVHWARDGEEANSIVVALTEAALARHLADDPAAVREVVKVKFMVTQEIRLNEALEAAGITAHETDLAELIVQLDGDEGSHVLVPAIHRNRQEIRESFLREIPGADPALSDPPRSWPRRRAGTCAGRSCARSWPSAAPTSPSPTPAHSRSSSPRATAGRASRRTTR